MTTAAIVQPNYIPWKGYFDLMASVDLFVYLDDAQYTRRDWRNRNQIKTQQGVTWLTIPVESKGNFLEPINSIKVVGRSWASKHWKTIKQAYSKSKHFHLMAERIEHCYQRARDCDRLTDINELFTLEVCQVLGIATRIIKASTLNVKGHKNSRLIEICKAVGASRYVSGPAAQVYLDESAFKANGISVDWMTYTNYPEYPQLYGDFVHQVSVIDLILNAGPESAQLFRKRA